jgi:N-dimethylarginine dimethylaminohydrolase
MNEQKFSAIINNKQINEKDILENILQEYKKLSKTPKFFVSTVQKIIYDLQHQKHPIAYKMSDPIILGSIIDNYLETQSENSIIQGLNNQLSENKSKNLLNIFSQKDIIDFIKIAAFKYLEYKKNIVPDIIFRPESGLFFKYNNTPYFFLSNFTAPHGKGTRLEEVKFNKAWAIEQGYNIIEIPKNLPFEGSAEVKYVKHKDNLDIIFGYGYRTDEKTIDWIVDKIKSIVKEDFSKINIIKAHMIDEDYYHLDVALKEIPIIKNDELVDETILYYPNAFDKATQKKLKNKYPNAIVLTKEDAESFACNSPTINKSIIIDQRVSKKLINELKERGLKVTLIDLSEFFKAGGGGKCLICELDEDIFDFTYEKNHKIQMLESPKGIFDIIYINDSYMEGKIGSVNKGLAEKQHKNLIDTLKKEGAEIFLMKTDNFKNDYDLEILRKATYSVFKKNKLNISEIDEFLSNFLNKTPSKYLEKLDEILLTYEKFYNSNPEYSWSILYQAMHEIKKKYNFEDLIFNNQKINFPEELFEIIKVYKNSI